MPEKKDDDAWRLVYSKFDAKKEKHTESLTAIGNGFFVTRGAFEENALAKHHYPGTYAHCVYNTLSSKVGDKTVSNEDLVNLPNWLATRVLIDGKKLEFNEKTIEKYHKELNLKTGIFKKKITIKQNGKITEIFSERFVSMKRKDVAAINYAIVPINYDANIEILTGIDGEISNENVERYKELSKTHLEKHEVKNYPEDNTISLQTTTSQSRINILMYSKHVAFLDGKKMNMAREIVIENNKAIYHKININAKKKQKIEIKKIISLNISQSALSSNVEDVKKLNTDKFSYEKLKEEHEKEFSSYWQEADIEVEGDETIQRLIRLHSYHLFITASKNTIDLDTSVPARGLHGEAYRGHIFWDEVYIFPFYFLNFPEIARSLLMYRFKRLENARKYARENGYKGAMFPWQSGSTGKEETQSLHLNPLTGKWGKDLSRLQRHISIAVAYNFLRYTEHTNDIAFLKKHGAETIFEILRFFVSIAKLAENTCRYHITGVMGPNEFHETSMNENEKIPGLPDNAYTNFMVAWLMQKGVEILSQYDLNDIKKKLGITDEEIKEWINMSKRMYLPVNNNIIEQYANFFSLKKLDFEKYKIKYKNIGRLDRILRSEKKDPSDYQISKQADLLMIPYLLNEEEYQIVFKNLGYEFDLQKHYTEYEKRTSHGSTLSFVVHAYLANKLQNKDEKRMFQKSLLADYEDLQGGTTKEGIHTGLMAGTLRHVVECYAGLSFLNDKIALNPNLSNSNLTSIKFSFFFRKVKYVVCVSSKDIKISASKKVTALIYNEEVSLGSASKVFKKKEYKESK